MLFNPSVGILQLPRSEAEEAEAREERSRKEQSVTSEPSALYLGLAGLGGVRGGSRQGEGLWGSFLCTQKAPAKGSIAGGAPVL